MIWGYKIGTLSSWMYCNDLGDRKNWKNRTTNADDAIAAPEMVSLVFTSLSFQWSNAKTLGLGCHPLELVRGWQTNAPISLARSCASSALACCDSFFGGSASLVLFTLHGPMDCAWLLHFSLKTKIASLELFSYKCIKLHLI